MKQNCGKQSVGVSPEWVILIQHTLYTNNGEVSYKPKALAFIDDLSGFQGSSYDSFKNISL
jgi:hypothetical protein